ncbi:MAG: helicase HerA domain-containing protein, partial [Desulfomonilaceae bacterium]
MKQLLIGKDVDEGNMFRISCDKSQRILVCGKTGTGKSYTMGVLIEELANIGEDIILVIDPQGIFWTMTQPNEAPQEVDVLWEYDRDPKGFRVNLLVPGDPVERYGGKDVVNQMERRGLQIQGLRLNPSDLSPEMWCELFNLDINELQGGMLFKAVRTCYQKLGHDFLLDDIASTVAKLRGLDKTKEAIFRKIEMAHDWQLFEEARYREIWEILQPNAV